MKIEVIVDSNREDIKYYLEDILKEMKDHDEVNEYHIRELEDGHTKFVKRGD